MRGKNLKLIGGLTAIKILGAFLGLFYSILQVRYFGASAVMDAFFVATSAVYLITSLTQGGQLAEVFLPEYLKMKENYSKESAYKLFSAIINRFLFFLIGLLIVLYFVSPFIINIVGPGLAPEFKELSIGLFRISLLIIVFTLFSSFVNTVLNAEQIYGRAELTGIVNSVLSLAILFYFKDLYGVWVLIYALLAGKIVEFTIGVIFLRKVGLRYYFIWNVEEYRLSHFFKIMFTTSGYVGATQLYSVTTTAMASFLPVGSLSLFNYVNQLSSKASGIILMPLTTVFFSKFSQIAVTQKKELTNYLRRPLEGITFVSVFIVILIILFGQEVLQIIWSKKNLTSEEFSIAYLMLILNFVGTTFSSSGQIFRKAAVALGGANQLYKGWVLVQLLSALFAFGAIYFFGIYGLASVLVINMALMSYVAIIVAQNNDIHSKKLLAGLIQDRKVIVTVIFLLSVTVGSVLLMNYFSISTIFSLGIKALFFGIVLMVLAFTFHKSDTTRLKDMLQKR